MRTSYILNASVLWMEEVSMFNGTQAIGESEIFELLLSTDVRWMEIAFCH